MKPMEIPRIDLLKITQDEIKTNFEFDDWNNAKVTIKQTLNANIGKTRYDIDKLFGDADGDLSDNEVKMWNIWLKDLGGDKLDTKNDLIVNNSYFEIVQDTYEITISNAAGLITSTEPIMIDITYDVISTAGKGNIEVNATFDTFETNYITTLDLPENYEVISHFSNEPINTTYPVEKALGYDVIIDPENIREEDPEWGGPALPPILPHEWVTLVIEENLKPVGEITVNESLDMVQDDYFFVAPIGEITFSGNGSSDTFYEWLEYNWYIVMDGSNNSIGSESYVTYDFTDSGFYNVWLKLTDSLDGMSWTNKTIVIDNEAPISKILADIVVDEGDEIIFDGSESSDESIGDYNGGLYNFSWEFGDGIYENDTIENITGLSNLKTTYNYEKPTRGVNYQVNLTVWDKAGNSAIITLDLMVNDTTKPNVEFNFEETVQIDEVVSFNAENSSDPEDGKIVNFYWDFGNGIYKNETVNTTTYTYTEAGEYTVTLNITDDEDNWDKRSFTINVNDIPVPNVGVINISWSEPFPTNGQEITINATVRNNGEVDVDGNVTVTFYYLNSNDTRVEIGKVEVTLEEGEEQEVNITWKATKKAEKIIVTIDEANVTMDRNQNDNELDKVIIVEPPEEDGQPWMMIIFAVIVILIVAMVFYKFVLAGGSGKTDKKGKKSKK